MRIDILTLFPAMFRGPLTESILKRAVESGVLSLHFHDIRDFAEDRRQVDQKPYGGGAGMLIMADPIVKAIEHVTSEVSDASLSAAPYRLYLSPRGKKITQTRVERLARRHDWLLLLCGHYEGIDHRVIEGGWIDEEISIGDYVLTGGELPAMVLIDAVARQLPGVLGKSASAEEESFSPALKRKREYPHYTRPEVFRGLAVPPELLSGHHAKIEAWRRSRLH